MTSAADKITFSLLIFTLIITSRAQNFNILSSCDFESNICNMVQRTNDDFDWTRKSGGTPSNPTGPSGAPSNSFYMFIEVSPAQLASGAKAILSTPTLSYRGSVCVRLSTHMFGQHIGTLKVYTDSGSPGLTVSGQQQASSTAAWTDRAVDVTLSNSNPTVSIEASKAGGVFGDIAIDNVRVIAGTCNNPQTKPPATNAPVTPGPTQAGTTNKPPDAITGTTCPNANVISFETAKATECGSVQATNDQMDWQVGSGKTESEDTGPERASDGTFYVHLEATGRNKDDTARLILRRPSFSGMVCVQFSYNMYGFHIGMLEFYTEAGNQRTVVFTIKGQQQSKTDRAWREALITINNDQISSLGFIGYRADGFSGDIAIDNIRYRSGSCDSPKSGDVKSCDFESNRQPSMCDMVQEKNDQFDWTLISGATPSDLTGPTSAASGIFYIYIEATDRSTNDTAIIYWPSLPTGENCLNFRYSMYGWHTGSLRVFVRSSGVADRFIFNESGEKDKSGVWRTARVDTGSLRSGDRLGFLAVRGTAFSSDIAIDDLRLKANRC